MMQHNYVHVSKRRGGFAITLGVLLLAGLITVSACKKKDNDDNNGNGNGTPALELVADGMVSPLGVVEPPDGSGRLFIIDQTGTIWIVKNGSKLSTPFIDLSSKMVALSPQYDERGLLGLAFHPDYKNNGRFFVFYCAPPGAGGPDSANSWNNKTTISEYKVSSSNADMADMSSVKKLIQIDDPQMNHNGGTLAFGPDGYLYISIGDGGAADDNAPGHEDDWYTVNEGGNAQNIYANLMGKVLRIDVNNGNPYAIPPDNPFVSTTGAKAEIWAFGFRNPYRFSFDMSGSKQLFLGDAGQKLYEEIDVVTKGGNYGWNVKEGTACFNTDSNLLIRPTCPNIDPLGITLSDPVIQLKNAAHPEGGGIATVIVGGNVYRGNSIPGWQGKYIFGTFSRSAMTPNAELYMSNPAGPGLWSYEEISLKDHTDNLGMYLRGFGQDQSGEVYITTSAGAGVSGNSGKVYKLVNVK